MDMFFAQQQKMYEEGGVGRTHAFNEMDDNIDFNEFTNIDEDDEKFGEIGDDGKVVDKEHASDKDELEDQVAELDFEDSGKGIMFEVGRKQRHTSAMVSNSELFQGLEEIKKKGNDLDERLKLIVGEDNWNPGQRERK
jgi:hypothetical protein